ncbi:MAG: hypothetical protein ABIG56_06045 [Candidatus Omnitrophota bacterium]
MRSIIASKKATGIIAVIFIVLMASVMGATITSLLGTDTGGSIYYLQSQQAFFIAEGGIQYVLDKLRLDEEYRASLSTVTEDLGPGSFSVDVVDQGSGEYTITSTGTVGHSSRQVAQSVDYTSLLLDQTIHGDGSSVNFSSTTSSTVVGAVSCHVSVVGYGGVTITGEITEGLARLHPSLDFSYYAGIADTYSTSNLTFANGTYNGVYYTTKKATIGNNVTLNGSIIAAGSIDFNDKADNVQISQSNNYPALASGSAINSSCSGPPSQRVGLQNSTINGLIFSAGNVTFNYMQNTTFNGSVLADGNLNFQSGSNWTIAYDETIFDPMTPGLNVGEELEAILQDDWNESY